MCSGFDVAALTPPQAFCKRHGGLWGLNSETLKSQLLNPLKNPERDPSLENYLLLEVHSLGIDHVREADMVWIAEEARDLDFTDVGALIIRVGFWSSLLRFQY